MGGIFSSTAKKPKDITLKDEVSTIVSENLREPLKFAESLGKVAAREKTTMLHLVVEHASNHLTVTDAIDEVLTVEAKRSAANRNACFFRQRGAEGEAQLTPLELAAEIMKDKSKAEGGNLFIDTALLQLAKRLNEVPEDDKHRTSAIGQIRSVAKSLHEVDNYAARNLKAMAKPASAVAATGVAALATREMGLGASV